MNAVARRIFICSMSVLLFHSSFGYSYEAVGQDTPSDVPMDLKNAKRMGKWLFSRHTSTVVVRQESIITESVPSSCVVVNPSLLPCRHARQIPVQPTSASNNNRIEKTIAPTLPVKNVVSATRLFPTIVGKHDGPSQSSRSDQFERASSSGSLDDVALNEHKPLSWKDYFLNFSFSSAWFDDDAYGQNKSSKKQNWGADYFGLDDVIVSKTSLTYATTKYYDPKTVITFSVVGCQPSRLPFNLPFCDVNATQPEVVESNSIHYVP